MASVGKLEMMLNACSCRLAFLLSFSPIPLSSTLSRSLTSCGGRCRWGEGADLQHKSPDANRPSPSISAFSFAYIVSPSHKFITLFGRLLQRLSPRHRHRLVNRALGFNCYVHIYLTKARRTLQIFQGGLVRSFHPSRSKPHRQSAGFVRSGHS